MRKKKIPEGYKIAITIKKAVATGMTNALIAALFNLDKWIIVGAFVLGLVGGSFHDVYSFVRNSKANIDKESENA